MKNILKIMNKELRRVITNKRMLASLILPGIIIFVIYSLVGSAMNKITTPTYNVSTVNMPGEIKTIIEGLGANFKYTELASADEVDTSLVKNGKTDLILVFQSKDFIADAYANAKDPGTSTAPEVTVYCNSSDTNSAAAMSVYGNAMNIFTAQVATDTLNRDQLDFFTTSKDSIDFGSPEKAAGNILASVIPLILVALLFSGCVAVTPESIAGEKERGTMATLLSTPVKRPQIAIGKVFALSILAAIGALSSFLGIIFSLPRLIPGAGSIFAMFSFGQLILVFFVLVATVFLIVSVLSIVSAFSQNVKEATMLSSIFLIIGLVFSLINMFSQAHSIAFFFIPVANTAAVVSSILNSTVNYINLAVTIIANLVYTALLVFGLSKMFNSEKIMFSKG